MRQSAVEQDSDNDWGADPNIEGSWEMAQKRAEKMNDEDDEIYGDPEKSVVFKTLDGSNPRRARRRVGSLYWKAWQRVMMSFFLTAFGVTFTIIGICCMKMCDEPERGLGFLVCGLLVLMPGCYGSLTLFFYVRGHKGFHWKDLPHME